ncbi:MAG: hypothetical protein PVJ32_07715 [Anaerolineales bacterium]|jgi:hypothetical protein
MNRFEDKEAIDMGKRAIQVTAAIMILGAMLLSGCSPHPQQPEGSLSVPELLSAPVFDAEVSVFGQVKELGELRCPCFTLVFKSERIYVWYDLMIEEDETQRPSVSMEGITNGDWVVVSGELRSTGSAASDIVFWAASIEVIE